MCDTERQRTIADIRARIADLRSRLAGNQESFEGAETQPRVAQEAREVGEPIQDVERIRKNKELDEIKRKLMGKKA
jgi:hypothetical protein